MNAEVFPFDILTVCFQGYRWREHVSQQTELPVSRFGL